MNSNIKRCVDVQTQPDQIVSTADDIIVGNEELVAEILQRLPAKSLVGFKLVSKTWLSLISSHRFSLLLCQYRRGRRPPLHPKISGLFFSCRSRNEIKYIPLLGETDCDGNGNGNGNSNGGQNKSLNFKPKFLLPYKRPTIIQSCNGILLCCLETRDCCDISRSGYNVYNPTTNQFTTLPWPHSNRDHPVYLDFKPLKAIHYKVIWIQIQSSFSVGVYSYQIHIYSSETNAWRPSGDPFSAPAVHIGDGVYCNGSIHWIPYTSKDTSIYFDVDQERLCSMPSPPYRVAYKFRHLMESSGHLHLTEYSDRENRFNVDVSELESDYSKWSLKYRVDLNAMIDFVSQEMIVPKEMSVLNLIYGEDEEDVFLVLFVGTNMIISYNVKDNTFKKLHDVAHRPGSCSGVLVCFKQCFVHPYIEALFRV